MSGQFILQVPFGSTASQDRLHCLQWADINSFTGSFNFPGASPCDKSAVHLLRPSPIHPSSLRVTCVIA